MHKCGCYECNLAPFPMEEARKRAAAGVAFLDGNLDDRWWDRINLNRLNLSDVSDCVLGQLFGTFGTGLGALYLSFENAARYGFALTDDEYEWHDYQGYCVLTGAWQELIEERRQL